MAYDRGLLQILHWDRGSTPLVGNPGIVGLGGVIEIRIFFFFCKTELSILHLKKISMVIKLIETLCV